MVEQEWNRDMRKEAYFVFLSFFSPSHIIFLAKKVSKNKIKETQVDV